MGDDGQTRKTISAGTVVHINGIPLRLGLDVWFWTHDNNWPLIGDELVKGRITVRPVDTENFISSVSGE